jgi:hypothetical protein
MKKYSLLLITFFFVFSVFSQEITFKSKFGSASMQNCVPFTKEHVVTITNDQIRISNYIGGEKEQILKIDKAEKKEFSFYGMCKWYYCTTTIKDPIAGITKVIIIIQDIPKPTQLDIYDFTDEVTINHMVLSL